MPSERYPSPYPPHRRRRRRRPKLQRAIRRYGRLALIYLTFVMVLAWGIKTVVVKPNHNSDPVQISAPASDPEELRRQAEAIGIEAGNLAAGYDYQGAIALIQSFQNYMDYDFLMSKISDYTLLDSQLISYPHVDQVTHIFFHSLIVDNSRAFDGDNREAGYNQYMTTIAEFKAILQSMYDKGYVLVSPYDVAYEVTDANGNSSFRYGDIRLPSGKTPFLMSQDDVNYYGYMIGNADGKNEIPVFSTAQGDGFASRIVIGDDGYPTCEYMDADGNVTTGDYDLVPILEHFIQDHPDFSYHGARAILGVTGYEGVFGYRTKPSYEGAMGTEAYNQEVAHAKAVAQCLKDHGWILASHSYGHPAYGNITAEKVEIDSDKWEDTVQPIIGQTDILLYPHGSDIAGVEQYSFDNAKFSALYDDGYRYFFNVDSSPYWCQLGYYYFRAGRRNLDGYRMYYSPGKLEDLFDVDSVFDTARPTPVPKI